MKSRRILALTLVLLLTALLSSTALAVTYPASGNTSPETAIEIPRNAVTPESKVNANTSMEHFATGSINPGEEYWYKVYLLPTFSSILSVNTDCVRVSVYQDPTGTPIFSEMVMKDYDEGLRAYDIPIAEAGMYYIRVHGALISHSFRVSLGNPNFNLDNVTVDGETITLRSGITSADGDLDVAGINTPEGAVVYQVVVNGSRSSRPLYETRSVRHGTSGFRQTNSSFLLTYSPCVDINGPWTIRWSGTASSTMTFQPEVTLYYAYPIPLS